MSDWLLSLVPHYGPWLIALVTFASCLALPVPASLVMVAGGTFAASGDLSLTLICLAALAGALAGDQVGYRLGRGGSVWLNRAARASPARQALIARAERLTNKWGGIGVFLSRWLVSPLGPYVNLLGAATGIGWRRFTLWSAAGEVIWVGLYTGLGFGFAANVATVLDATGSIGGLLATGVGAMVLGHLLFARRRRKRSALAAANR